MHCMCQRHEGALTHKACSGLARRLHARQLADVREVDAEAGKLSGIPQKHNAHSSPY